MREDPIDYYRRRERAEREAARSAPCEQARWAHQQMAEAYARRIELEEAKATGAGKVVSVADVLRSREETEYGRRIRPSARAGRAPGLRA